MGQLRLIVFGTDPATVMARSRGMFKSQGLDVDITVTPNSTDQGPGREVEAGQLDQLPRDAVLNVAGLKTALELRVGLGLTPPMGKDVSRYYDPEFYRLAVG